MADASGNSRNNVLAGTFILSILGVGIAVIIVLSGWNPFVQKNSYSVRFTVEEGIGGLAEGSNVKIGGLNKGMVMSVNPVFTNSNNKDNKNNNLDSILVNFELDDDVTLYSNAEVTRYMPLLGGSAWLNFTDLGGPTSSSPDKKPIEPGGELTASTGGGIMATLLGPTDSKKASGAMQNIEDFTAFLNQIPEEWNNEVMPMLTNARLTLGKVRTDYDLWSTKIGATIDNIDQASEKLDAAMDDAGPMLAGANQGMARINGILEDNTPRIDDSMQNILAMTKDGRVVMNEFRTKTMSQVDQILMNGLNGVKSLDNSLKMVNDELILRMPDVTMMLANLRQATAQLKLTTLEVRRNPWKLLYTPTSEVLEHENLYESARSYVMATSELESAAMAFKSVFELAPKTLEDRPELRDEVVTYVLDSLERFKHAQERLFSEIVDQ
jgi:ABC-type transporter Mla subunit MlaD